jgi:hypothetical protein
MPNVESGVGDNLALDQQHRMIRSTAVAIHAVDSDGRWSVTWIAFEEIIEGPQDIGGSLARPGVLRLWAAHLPAR